MILNITIAGRSTDHELSGVSEDYTDDDARRLATEIKGIHPGALDTFMVDRVQDSNAGDRMYIRPKVPFGAGEPKKHNDRSLIARMAANILSGHPDHNLLVFMDGDLKYDAPGAARGAVALARSILAEIDKE